MVQQLYTKQQLEQKSIGELKEICDRLSIPRRRSKQDCIADILAAQPQLVKPVEQQSKTCADCPHFKTHADGTDKGWCCLFDRFAREPHAMTQDCVNTTSEEQIDDYLFHDEPTNLPKVGDTHFVGSFLLRCSQVGGEYAALWEVFDENVPMGEIKMGWNCFWHHTMSVATFATPQEAVVDLHASLQQLLEQQDTKEKQMSTIQEMADFLISVKVLAKYEKNKISPDTWERVFTFPDGSKLDFWETKEALTFLKGMTKAYEIMSRNEIQIR